MSRRAAVCCALLLALLSGGVATAAVVDTDPLPIQPCYRVTVAVPEIGHSPYVDVCVPGH
jgi:hypothetical protein